MLNFIRSHAASWVVRVLFLLLIVSFAAWGIGDILRMSFQSNRVATVGKVEITGPELMQQFDREMRAVQPIFGGKLDREQARQLGVLDRALQSMITTALIDQQASALGLAVGERQAEEQIRHSPSFQDPSGQFSPELFHQVLANNRMGEDTYLAFVRGDMLRSQLTGALVTGVSPPRLLAETLYAYRNETRAAQAILIAAAAMTDLPTPDESALKAFHDAHQDLFKAPEYRALSLLVLSPEELAPEIQVSDADIKAEYDSRVSEFAMPEKRTITQAVLSDEAGARKILDLMAGGMNFDAATRQATGRASIDLGAVARTDLPAALADAVFSTPAGQVTNPVQSPLGWHVVLVKSATSASTRTLEDMRDTLRKELALRQANDSLTSISNQLEDELAGGATLEEAAGKLKLKMRKIPALAADGTAPDGSRIADLPASEDFFSQIFALDQGAVSPLLDLGPSGYAVVRVDSVAPTRIKTVEEVHDKVLAAWQDAERRKAARAKADALAKRIEAGEDIASLAKEAGTNVVVSRNLKRAGEDPNAGITTDLSKEIFDLKPGGVTSGDYPLGAVVVRLNEIVPADPKAASEEINKLLDGLGQNMSDDLLSAYANGLRKHFPVEIDRPAIDALF